MSYGAFVEFLPGKEGLLHISEWDWRRFETIEETALQRASSMWYSSRLTPRQASSAYPAVSVIEKPEGYVERPERPRGERNGDRNRGPRNGRRNHD